MRKEFLTAGLALIVWAYYGSHHSTAPEVAKEETPVVIKEPEECATEKTKNELTLKNYKTCLDSLVNEQVMIYTWADWCPPCMKFKPDYEKLRAKYGDKVVFLTVDLSDIKTAVAKNWVMMNYVGIDDGNSVPKLTILKKDTVLKEDTKVVGLVDWNYDKAENFLDAFFDL